MTPIPRSALFLGLAGLIPFLVSVATELSPALSDLAVRTIGPRFVGPYMALAYGTIILSFMSGVLWGFATKATGHVATYGYAISVIPALWAFFFVGSGPVRSAIWLSVGFLLLIGLDMMFWPRGLAPPRWMRLRVVLTMVVVACLMVTAFVTG
ncbi:MAG: DUF3429 domain-containing protein [Paracoccaceae bacterium]